MSLHQYSRLWEQITLRESFEQKNIQNGADEIWIR